MGRAMMRRRIGWLIVAAIVLVPIGAFIWWFLFSEFMAMDRCLDSGGRWGEGGSCEYEPRPE